MINNLVYLDTINTIDGTYTTLPLDNNFIKENSFLSNTNGSVAPIVYSDGVSFDGTNGLVYNDSKGLINLSNSKMYIEFDFTLTSNSGDSAGLQTIFSFGPSAGIHYITEACYITTNHMALIFVVYNDNAGIFASHYINHKFELNVKYNIKIFKTSTNGLSIFLNNELKYRIASYNTGNAAKAGARSTYQYSNYFRIGQRDNTVATHNLKGKIHDFRIISYLDEYNGQSFESKASNLIHHFKLEGWTPFTDSNLRRFAAVDLGNNLLSSTITSPVIATGTYVDLSDNELWWYKAKNGSANRLTISKHPFKYYTDVTISFRITTGSTVETCSILDSRSATNVYDGMLVTQPSADPSKIDIYLSSKSNTTSWASTISTPTGLLLPNSEYKIQLVKQGNAIRLYVNSIEQISYTADFADINWVSEKLDIFNNSAGTAEAKFYAKDFRIYNIVYLDQDSIDQSKILSANINVSDNAIVSINEPAHLLSWKDDQPKFDSSYIYTNPLDNVSPSYYNDMTLYNKNGELFLFVEGHKNHTINLYKNNFLIKSNFNNEYMDIHKKSDYYYVINETGIKKQLPEKSMIESTLTIYYQTTNCDGSDLYVRIYKSNNGEFIGDYDLINNYAIIENLDYNEYYDAVLIDKNKVLENKVKSKLRPIPNLNSNGINIRDSITYIRELTYYEAKQNLGNQVDALIASNPNASLLSIMSINTDRNSLLSKINIDSDGAGYTEVGNLNFASRIEVDEYVAIDAHSFKIKVYSGIDKLLSGILIQANNEIMQIDNYDVLTNIITVKRGLLDTFPVVLKQGQNILIVSECLNIDQSYNKGTNINVKNVTSLGFLDQNINDISEKSIIMDGRIARPAPPCNIKLNGFADFNIIVENYDSINITWNHRYKDEILDYYDSTVINDQINDQIIYKVDIYKILNNGSSSILVSSNNLGNTTSYTFNINETDPLTNGYNIELYSIINNIESIKYIKFINLNTDFSEPYNIITKLRFS